MDNGYETSPPTASESFYDSRGRTQYPPAANLDHGLLEPNDSKFAGRDASIAFAVSLGLELQSDNLPLLHAFGWNLGIRQLPKRRAHASIFSLLAYSDLQCYADHYFKAIHPVYGFLAKETFMKRCVDHWRSQKQSLAFEALLSCVVALGSLFSAGKPLAQEFDLINHAQSLCEDPSVVMMPSVDYVAALLLWGFYTRATQKPHTCWMINCQALHAAEAVGLHKDPEAAAKALGVSATLPPEEIEQRSRLFWLIKAKNLIVSFELGRSPVTIQNITCKYPSVSPTESPMAAFLELAHLLPKTLDLASLDNINALRQVMSDSLSKIASIPKTFHAISLTAADVAFCIYRRMRALGERFTQTEQQKLVNLGEIAMDAAHELLRENQPWFQLVNTTFQYICVLISLDSPDSLPHLRGALVTLTEVANQFQSHLTKEALSTAMILVRALKQKKSRELALLDEYDSSQRAFTPNQAQVQFDVPFSDADLPLSWFNDANLNFNNLTAPEVG